MDNVVRRTTLETAHFTLGCASIEVYVQRIAASHLILKLAKSHLFQRSYLLVATVTRVACEK